MNKHKTKIVYIWDEELIQQSDRLPAVAGRASLVHNLISAYDILNKVQVVRSTSATYDDLKSFHSELYLDHLKKLTVIDDEYVPNSLDEEYGIVYDCAPVSDMYKLVSTIAGGSITAAKCLILGIADVAINWYGGWHHAQRFGAEGFCYVNDIVLAIETLRKKFPKILYIDLDVHHGNGVQDAYNLSKSVFTLSFHKYEPGFYPGSGSIEDIGTLTGKGYSCNFPLKGGYSDGTLEYVFEKVFMLVYFKYKPDAIVLQCGADALARDPHGGAGLTTTSYSKCLKSVLDRRKPTILLGGGGYKHNNAARLWTTLIAQAAKVTLNENIPEHDQWPRYGPDFLLTVETTLAKDSNTKEYLDKCISIIEMNLNSIDESPDDEPLIKQQKSEIITHTRFTANLQFNHASRNVSTSKSNLLIEKHQEMRNKKSNTIYKSSHFKHNVTAIPTSDNKIDVYEFVD